MATHLAHLACMGTEKTACFGAKTATSRTAVESGWIDRELFAKAEFNE